MWTDLIKSTFDHKENRGQIILKVCPFCDNDNYNLEFSVEKGVYHCWICSASGRVNKFLKSQGLPIDKDQWEHSTTTEVKPKEVALTLDSFDRISFEKHRDFFVGRGLDEKDIEKYQFRVGRSGKEKGKLIIPLYEGKKLVYFVARDLEPRGRYFNIQKGRGDLVPYFMGEENRYVLHLCEGVFDAISVNKLGFTSGVLLGTILSNDQVSKIKKFGFQGVVVCLDGDAREKGIAIAEKLWYNSVPSKVVLLDGKEDPNSLYVENWNKLVSLLTSPQEVTLSLKVGEILKK
jgi:hypothetical protein